MGIGRGEGTSSKTWVSNSFAPGVGIFPEGPADGNEENWTLAWPSAASVCVMVTRYLSPPWASMHVGVTDLLVCQDSGSLWVLLSVQEPPP